MKLWTKSILGLGVIGTVTGATVGGMYAYAKLSPIVKGHAHATSLPLENDLSSMSHTTEEKAFKELDLHFINQGDLPNTSIASYNADFTDSSKDTVTYNGKVMKYNDFITAYVLENGTQPTLVTYAGTALFENQYLTAVNGNDFAHYVAWFMTNVAWGPDMASLDSFSIVSGIEKVGSAVMLGGHAAVKKEGTNIKFYPDAFFGSLPIWSDEAGQSNASDALTYKGNITPMTKDELTMTINANKLAKSFGLSVPTPRVIKDVGLLPGTSEHGYIVYWDGYTGLIDKLLEDPIISKLALKETDGMYVDADGNLKEGAHKGLSLDTRISYLDVVKVSDDTWKGIGYNFLKYVGAHEYGHHQTLQTAMDISESGALSGAYKAQSGINQGSFYDKDVMNLYLSARAADLRVTGVDAEKTDADNPRDMHLKFWENGVAEKGQPSSDGGRGSMTWTELQAEAKRRGISVWSLIIENSFDAVSGTLNPKYDGDAYYFDKTTHKLVKGSDALTSGGLYSTYDSTGAVQPLKFEPTKPGLEGFAGIDGLSPVVDDGTNWLVFNEGGIPFFNNGKKPGDIFQAATATAPELTWADIVKNFIVKAMPFMNYKINGWNTSDDGLSDKDKITKALIQKTSMYDDYASLFADYTNNFPEVLTRDNLQEVYLPSEDNLDNTPTYLTGITEASSGFEYMIDGSKTSSWTSATNLGKSSMQNNMLGQIIAYEAMIESQFTSPALEKVLASNPSATIDDIQPALYAALDTPEAKTVLAGLRRAVEASASTIGQSTWDTLTKIFNGQNGELYSYTFAKILSDKNDYLDVTGNKIKTNEEEFNFLTSTTDSSNTLIWQNGYTVNDATTGQPAKQSGFRDMLVDIEDNSFVNQYYLVNQNFLGVTQKSSNGWFKDKTMKQAMGASLYMNDGSPRKINTDPETGNDLVKGDDGYWDPSSIIKKFDGSTPETYAEAQWMFTLREKGVGSRTLTGIWRDSSRDAAYMWGYIPTGSDAKYLEFIDNETGEKKYLPIQTGVDNLYYNTEQKIGATKHTLAEDGFTSWMSDFTAMGAYRNAFLKADHKYTVEFADSDKKVIENLFTMGKEGEVGSRHVIAENGKTPSQAPTVFNRQTDGKVILTVKKQFNI